MKMIDRVSYRPDGERYGPLSDIIFRILFSLIFIVGGLGHFGRHHEMLSRIQESPWAEYIKAIGNPSILLWLSGIVLIFAGVSLALGFKTRLSALALFVTVIPITIAVHIAPGHVGPFLKNVALLGGLVHFFIRGPGFYSIDQKQIYCPKL